MKKFLRGKTFLGKKKRTEKIIEKKSTSLLQFVRCLKIITKNKKEKN